MYKYDVLNHYNSLNVQTADIIIISLNIEVNKEHGMQKESTIECSIGHLNNTCDY